jgi:hypothetical protein
MDKNRIIHVSIDQEINSQVDFDNLDEAIYLFFTALGIEVVITSEDEEVPEVNNG